MYIYMYIYIYTDILTKYSYIPYTHIYKNTHIFTIHAYIHSLYTHIFTTYACARRRKLRHRRRKTDTFKHTQICTIHSV